MIVVDRGQRVVSTLAPIEDPNSKSTVIKVPTLNGEYFLIENRQRIVFDKDLPSTGVLLIRVGDATSGRAFVRVIDANPQTETLGDAAFDLKQTFIDENAEVNLKILSKDGLSYSLQLSNAEVPALRNEVNSLLVENEGLKVEMSKLEAELSRAQANYQLIILIVAVASLGLGLALGRLSKRQGQHRV